jgi:hypothetical protein
MFKYDLPREKETLGKSTIIPERYLGLGNFTPKYKEGTLIADMDFIQYRKASEEKSQDIIRMQNYSNYQSVCLAQNIDDMAQYILQTKSHITGIHTDLDQLESSSTANSKKLDELTQKLDIVMEVLMDLRTNMKREQDSLSPPLSLADFSCQDYYFFFYPKSSSPKSQFPLLKGINNQQSKLPKIKKVVDLAQEKLQMIKNQLSQQLIEIKDIKEEQPESSQANQENTPKVADEQGNQSFQTAWEKWCNAKYGSKRKIPYDPTNSEDHSRFSRENIDPSPISNLNCKSKMEIEMVIQKWNAWEKTQKAIFKNKVTWSELTLRLTWGFTGNLDIWWKRLNLEDKIHMMESEKPLEELTKVVLHEFYGKTKVNTQLYSDLFMSQLLCNIKDLPEFYCTMQDLLYKSRDPNNHAYLRKYLSVMPGKIPDLVRERMEEEDIDIEELSLAGIHEQIMTTLQKECIRRKTAKSVKKEIRI